MRSGTLSVTALITAAFLRSLLRVGLQAREGMAPLRLEADISVEALAGRLSCIVPFVDLREAATDLLGGLLEARRKQGAAAAISHLATLVLRATVARVGTSHAPLRGR